MLIQEIEKKIIDSISDSLSAVENVSILGTWQSTTAGYVKNQIEAESDAIIVVSLGTMTRDTFSSPTCTTNGSIVITVKLERDVDGTKLLQICTPIEELLNDLQSRNYQNAFTDFDIDGKYSCDCISLVGGQPAQLSFADKTITVTWSFTLNGVVI